MQDERQTSSGHFYRTLFRLAWGRHIKGTSRITDFIQLRGRIGVFSPRTTLTTRKKRHRGLQQQLDTARHHRPIISCTEARSEHHCRQQRTWSDRRNKAAPLHNDSRYAHGIPPKGHRQSRNIRPRCPSQATSRTGSTSQQTWARSTDEISAGDIRQYF